MMQQTSATTPSRASSGNRLELPHYTVVLLLCLVFVSVPPAMSDTASNSETGVNHDSIAGCPDSPNCVSSTAPQDDSHHIDPFILASPVEQSWNKVIQAVPELPRTKIVRQTDSCIFAESRSRVFRFVDDLSLCLHAPQGLVAVRSASRTGYSDFGVNRKRVEKLRKLLSSQGVLRDSPASVAD